MNALERGKKTNLLSKSGQFCMFAFLSCGTARLAQRTDGACRAAVCARAGDAAVSVAVDLTFGVKGEVVALSFTRERFRLYLHRRLR